MSLISTTIYNPVVWSVIQWDYVTGNVIPGTIILPGEYNLHTVWVAQFLYPPGLIGTPVLTRQRPGLLIDFQTNQGNGDYPLYFFRPPASGSAAGTLSAAGLQGPGFAAANMMQGSYTYGIYNTSSAVVPIIGQFASDENSSLPLGTISSASQLAIHSVRDAMVHVSWGGSNTAPNSIAVVNMAICFPIRVKFAATKIVTSCPLISDILTGTSGQPYWCYGFAMVRSEQV